MSSPVSSAHGVRQALLPPRLLVVADAAFTGGRPLLAVVREVVAGGARGVWLRDKQAAPGDRRRLAEDLAELLHAVGGVLIESPGPGSGAGDGIHLGATDPWPGGASQAPVGRSCHSLSELSGASAEGCQWATLSPIYRSGSKPGYGPPLGPAALNAVPLPTWALGGVDAENAAECLEHGAAGVAVMGPVLRSPDPAAAFAKIQHRLDEVQR
ncbi:MAG TPA: thiamine phosphate synthase [Acidimicrobiales bacterium]|nr:thiamine phosphate synthase [Acidimicrobiales bacterium]